MQLKYLMYVDVLSFLKNFITQFEISVYDYEEFASFPVPLVFAKEDTETVKINIKFNFDS